MLKPREVLFKSLLVIIFLSILHLSSAQYNILNSLVVNSTMCKETDSGIDYLNAGAVTGMFFWLDPGTKKILTYSGTVNDYCIPGTTILAEGVCGSSVAPSLSGLAGLINVDCKISGYPNSGCYQRACVKEVPRNLKGYSYMARAVIWLNKTTILYVTNRSWKILKSNVKVNDTFSLEDIGFEVLSLSTNPMNKSIKLKITNGSFDRIYNNEGNYIKIKTDALPTKSYADVIYDKYGNIIGNFSAYVYLESNNRSYDVAANSSVKGFNFERSSDEHVHFDNVSLRNAIKDIDLIYTRGGPKFIGFGADVTSQLAISNSSILTFDPDYDSYFIASYYPGA